MARDRRQTQVLKDLNTTLQIHAERIRLRPTDWLKENPEQEPLIDRPINLKESMHLSENSR